MTPAQEQIARILASEGYSLMTAPDALVRSALAKVEQPKPQRATVRQSWLRRLIQRIAAAYPRARDV